MPSITLELWRVLEFYPEGDNPTYANIGLSDYPIFEEDYRPLLNQKIVDHFHNREIGQESVSMWKFAMRRKMHEIMPLYNQIYKSTQIEFDPLVTMNMRSVVTGESTANAEAQANNSTVTTGSAKSRAVQSQTPQVMLSANKDYASSGADSSSYSENDSTANETSTSNTAENSSNVSETKGYQAMPADLIMAYRATLLNVDMLVIDELNELFLGIWNTGDEYTRRKGYFLR
jgi:hypothetical protein